MNEVRVCDELYIYIRRYNRLISWAHLVQSQARAVYSAGTYCTDVEKKNLQIKFFLKPCGGIWSHNSKMVQHLHLDSLRMRLSFSSISRPRVHQFKKSLCASSRGGLEDSNTPPTCKIWMIFSQVMAISRK